MNGAKTWDNQRIFYCSTRNSFAYYLRLCYCFVYYLRLRLHKTGRADTREGGEQHTRSIRRYCQRKYYVKSVQIRSFFWSLLSRIRTRKNLRIWTLFTQWSWCLFSYNTIQNKKSIITSVGNLHCLWLYEEIYNDRKLYRIENDQRARKVIATTKFNKDDAHRRSIVCNEPSDFLPTFDIVATV